MTDSLERIEREMMIDEAVRGVVFKPGRMIPCDGKLMPDWPATAKLHADAICTEFRRLDYKRLHQCDEPLAGVRTR